MDKLKIEDRLDEIKTLLISSTKKVLTFSEACTYMGLSSSYVYKLTSAGKIPFSKPNGKNIFFDREKLDQWLLQNHVKSDQEIENEAINYSLKTKKA